MRHLLIPSIPWWDFVLRVVIVFTAVIFLLRIGGKRQVAQLGIPEFVALLLISNAVQNAMTGGDESLSGGLILAFSLIVLSWLFQYASFKSRAFEALVQGRPTLLIHHGKILTDHLRKEYMNIRELRAILRKQGIHDVNDVEEAVLESDGFVSVTRRAEVPQVEEWRRSDVY